MRFQSENEKDLIKRFRLYPLVSLLLNLIPLFIFIGALSSFDSPVMKGYLPFLLFAIGCVCVLLLQTIYPPYYRRAIALAMMEKKQMNPQTAQIDEFQFYYQQECAICGSLQKTSLETVCKILGIAVKLFNFLFYLLSALLAVAIAGIIAVVLGGFLWLASLFLGGVLASLAQACTRPLRAAIAFLLRVVSLRDYFDAGDGGAQKAFETITAKSRSTTSNTKTKEKSQSGTHLRKYISISDNGVLPANICWDGKPEIWISHTQVLVEGKVIVSGISRKQELSLRLTEACDAIRARLEKQVADFRRDYPYASDVDIDVNLSGRIS